jgi:HlyD family secretion protein
MKADPNLEPELARTLAIGKSRGYSRWLKRLLVLCLLIVVAVAGASFFRQANRSQSPVFKTEKARRGDLVVTVTATGTLQPTNTVQVGSELSGIIKQVMVDHNERVKVGQALARLDTSKLEAQLAQYQATLESAKARVLQAQATVSETRSKLLQFQKVRELSDNRVPSQAEYDAAVAALERALADEASAKAAVSQAQAAVRACETDLSKAIIRSPVNGVVISRNVEPGQTVAASFQAPVLFTIAEDLRQMELHVDVDEADVGKVKEGQKATFTVDAYPNRVFQAHITEVRYGSKTVEGVVTYETVLKVDNSDLSLRPGMTATAVIKVEEVKDALLIPNAALRFTPPVEEEKMPSRGLTGVLLPRMARPSSRHPALPPASRNEQRVWILKEGRPSPLSVTVGSTDGIMTEVLRGEVRPGTELIVDIVAKEK